MASTYKTPGVYVEEISKFPPSIASVETAIPAFIGYTETATETVEGDLLREAVRISAIADYERYFGGPDLEKGFDAKVVDAIDPLSKLLTRTITVPAPAVMSKFMLYNSVRLYFANGGGPCYIISVGNYKDGGGNETAITLDDLGNNPSGNGGPDVLELEDEPTLILFPDAQALAPAKYYSLCQAALAQCNKLQDRFAIFDTLGSKVTAPQLFRNFIGTDFLKYGAVYYPFLDTAYNYAYDESQVKITQTAASLLSLPVSTVADINTEKGKVDAAVTAITAIDVNTPTNAVLTAADLPTRQAALPAVKTAADSIKTQVDLIIASLQTIVAKAGAFNTQFSDPDVTLALNAIDLSLFTAHTAKLGSISQNVTAALAPGSPAGIPELDAIATDLKNLVSIAGVNNDLTDHITDLKINLVPALVSGIQNNDPAAMISQVNTALANATAARTALVGVQTNNLVTAVTAPAVTDANALSALQNGIKTANTGVLVQIGVLSTSVTSVSDATANASQIPFLKNTFSSVQSINPAILDGIKNQLTAVDAGITAATVATTRNDVNKLATDFDSSMTDLTDEMNQIFISLTNQANAVNYLSIGGKTLSDIKQIDNTSYNEIKLAIDDIPVTLPPCSAIAGKYAQVDRDRGVWKSPANVSLAFVIGPTAKVSNDIQDGLNVDPVAGKSVNVIRAFAGQGTLIWGARTLSGNDNEWRYVSVRRFFIFAEESVKKACNQFVFEPNDSNTWVKVRAMIENWLTLQWRAGALAGAKTDDAFYVRIGLGQTMTDVDILEGRMNVEVGMAVVRPAEFIVLKFSHKMQES